MANPFYTHSSGQPISLSRGSSSTIRAEFDLIQTGFDTVNTATGTTLPSSIALKGAIAGQVWTGTHDYTGGLLRVATPVSATDAVTKQYADGLSFAAALPAISGGVANYFVTNNGAIGSWSNKLNANTIRFSDNADATKLLAFSLAGLTTATTRTVTVPDKSGTLAMLSDISVQSTKLLATITPTAGAQTVDALNVFTAGYDAYLIVAEGLNGNQGAANDTLNIRLANAGVVDVAANYAGGGTFFGPAVSLWGVGLGLSFNCSISNVNSASTIKMLSSIYALQTNGTPTYSGGTQNAYYIKSATVSGFRLFWAGATQFAAQGVIYVYGYSNT